MAMDEAMAPPGGAGGDGEAVAGVAMAMHDWAALGGEAVGRAVKPGS